jgi:hypothetical protein
MVYSEAIVVVVSALSSFANRTLRSHDVQAAASTSLAKTRESVYHGD